MLASGALDAWVSPLEFALGDAVGELLDTHGGGVDVVTVEEIAR